MYPCAWVCLYIQVHGGYLLYEVICVSLHVSVGATAMGEALHTGCDVSGPQRLIRPAWTDGVRHKPGHSAGLHGQPSTACGTHGLSTVTQACSPGKLFCVEGSCYPCTRKPGLSPPFPLGVSARLWGPPRGQPCPSEPGGHS